MPFPRLVAFFLGRPWGSLVQYLRGQLTAVVVDGYRLASVLRVRTIAERAIGEMRLALKFDRRIERGQGIDPNQFVVRSHRRKAFARVYRSIFRPSRRFEDDKRL